VAQAYVSSLVAHAYAGILRPKPKPSLQSYLVSAGARQRLAKGRTGLDAIDGSGLGGHSWQ
jgi:hypothetical protein